MIFSLDGTHYNYIITIIYIVWEMTEKIDSFKSSCLGLSIRLLIILIEHVQVEEDTKYVV